MLHLREVCNDSTRPWAVVCAQRGAGQTGLSRRNFRAATAQTFPHQEARRKKHPSWEGWIVRSLSRPRSRRDPRGICPGRVSRLQSLHPVGFSVEKAATVCAIPRPFPRERRRLLARGRGGRRGCSGGPTKLPVCRRMAGCDGVQHQAAKRHHCARVGLRFLKRLD